MPGELQTSPDILTCQRHSMSAAAEPGLEFCCASAASASSSQMLALLTLSSPSLLYLLIDTHLEEKCSNLFHLSSFHRLDNFVRGLLSLAYFKRQAC